MKIFISNINRLNEDIENFCIVKSKIEKKKIEDGILEKKDTVQDYISNLELQSNIFMINNKENSIVPFNIFQTDVLEVCISYSYSGEDENLEKTLLDELKKCKYNLKNLKMINQIDVLQGRIKDIPYFIINGDFYIN